MRPAIAGPDAGGAAVATRDPRPTFRLPALDGLRSLVLLVLVVHFADSAFNDGHAVSAWTTATFIPFRYGALVGLEMFFVLSGFLITGILLDTRESTSYFKTFYARRFLRIFPLYYATLTIHFFVLPAITAGTVGAAPLEASLYATYYSYLTNFAIAWGWPIDPATGHFWSLAVEEQFYLVWPLVVYMCSRPGLKRVCIAVIVGSLGLRWLFVLLGRSGLEIYALTFTRLDGLAVGAMTAILWRESDRRGFQALQRVILTLTFVAVAGTVWTIADGARMLRFDSTVHLATYLTAGVIFGAALLLRSLTAPSTSMWFRVVESRALQRLGQYSYGIYVLHLPVAGWIHAAGWWVPPAMPASPGARLIYAALAIPIGVAAGAFSWHLLESPLARMKKHIPYEFGSRARRAAGYGRRGLAVETNARARPDGDGGQSI